MKLTEAQKRLAEENMPLVKTFIRVHAPKNVVALYRSPDEVYQVCSEAFLVAVQVYTQERGELSTVAFRCMRNALLANACKQHPYRQLVDEIVEEVDESLLAWLLADGASCLTADERAVFIQLANGCTLQVAASRLRISRQRVTALRDSAFERIRNKWRDESI